MYSGDTHPEAERIQVEILRGMSIAHRLRMVGELNRTIRAVALAGIRSRLPEATAAEIEAELMRLLLGGDLARRVEEIRRRRRPEMGIAPDARSAD